jgi:hypothetical protein
MLGIAYASTIVGTASPVGHRGIMTFLSSYGEVLKVTSLGWMAVGVPFALALGLVGWILLARLFPLSAESLLGGRKGVLERRKQLGSMNAPNEGCSSSPSSLPCSGRLANSGLHRWASPSAAIAYGGDGHGFGLLSLPVGRPEETAPSGVGWTTRVPWVCSSCTGARWHWRIKSAGLGSYFGNTLASILQDVPSDTGKDAGHGDVRGGAHAMMSAFAAVQITSPILLQVASQLS